MKRRYNNGFAPVELIIVLVIVAVIGLVGYLVLGRGKLSGDKSPASSPSGQGVATGKLPVLQSLAGISFGPYDKAAGTSGDFVFSRSAANQVAPQLDMLFVPFAQDVCLDKAAGSGCTQITEAAMNGLRLGTVVKAAAGGTISGLQQAEDGGSAFMTTSSDYPGYAIGYTHVSQLTVKEGDTVSAGQVMGKAAPYGDGSFARVGLYIKKHNAAGQVGLHKVCPFDYLDAKAEATVTPAIKQFFSDWNEFVGSKVYQLSEMRRPGCVASHTTE